MTEFEERFREKRRMWKERHHGYHRGSNGRGHVWTGVFLLLIGAIALIRNTTDAIPDWVYSWEMLLIALGLFIGFRHRFRGGVWFILILIGSVFLINDIYPDIAIRQYLWPMALIAAGLFFIFRPRRRFCPNPTPRPGDDKNEVAAEAGPVSESSTQDDYVDSTSVFGGVKKNVVSKNFKGGDVVNIFGGSELNLGQADIHGKVELEVTQIFGGTKLYVPSNWEVKPEMVAIFGGIEDKRDMAAVTNPEKVLILRGTSIFAGIEIRSF